MIALMACSWMLNTAYGAVSPWTWKFHQVHPRAHQCHPCQMPSSCRQSLPRASDIACEMGTRLVCSQSRASCHQRCCPCRTCRPPPTRSQSPPLSHLQQHPPPRCSCRPSSRPPARRCQSGRKLRTRRRRSMARTGVASGPSASRRQRCARPRSSRFQRCGCRTCRTRRRHWYAFVLGFRGCARSATYMQRSAVVIMHGVFCCWRFSSCTHASQVKIQRQLL